MLKEEEDDNTTSNFRQRIDNSSWKSTVLFLAIFSKLADVTYVKVITVSLCEHRWLRKNSLELCMNVLGLESLNNLFFYPLFMLLYIIILYQMLRLRMNHYCTWGDCFSACKYLCRHCLLQRHFKFQLRARINCQ